jgi:hypothetical protein
LAGDAEPLGVVLDPGVGEAAVVLVGLAFEDALLMGGADYDYGVAVAVKLHVSSGLESELIGFVADGNEELGFVQDGAVEVGEHEVVVEHAGHGVAVVGDLDLVPEIFEGDDFGFIAVGLREGLG